MGAARAETNLVWKHSEPKSARYIGRQILVTFRAHKYGMSNLW